MWHLQPVIQTIDPRLLGHLANVYSWFCTTYGTMSALKTILHTGFCMEI